MGKKKENRGGREPRGHERQAARRRDESARNKVSCRGERALKRLQTRGEFSTRPPFLPPRFDRTKPPSRPFRILVPIQRQVALYGSC